MGTIFFLQVVAAWLLAYVPFAGWMSIPWTGDQKVYLSTALEMQEQKSLLVPYLFGEPSYYKPPLQYWSTLAGFRIFGNTLWGAFLPSAIAALVAALATWSIARRLLPVREDGRASSGAHRAALWFLGCIGTATFGVAAQMEIHLVAVGFTAWALALAYLERSPRERLGNPWALYSAFATAGVLAWVKSPLYSVLWGVGYLMMLVLRREWREFRSIHFYVAAIFGAVVGASWYLTVLGLDYDRFVSDYVVRETFGKQGGNGGTPAELWGTLVLFCAPFALLAISSLRALAARAHRPVLFFAAAAGLPAAAFFTIYPYRVTTYLYVLVPVLAILAAWIEVVRPRLAVLVMRGSAILLAIATAWLVWLSIRIGVATGWCLAALAILGVVSCAAWIRAALRPRSAVWASLVLVAWLHAVAVTLGERDLAGLRAFAEGNPHRPIATVDENHNIWHEAGLLSVALGRPVERLEDAEEVLDALDSGHAVVMTEEQAERIVPSVHELLDEDEDDRRVETRTWPRFEERRRLPVGELIRAQRKLELDRRFRILTLPATSDEVPPEGGV